ncbi:tripartite tricarboxylate transporter substrate binding protein [Belnapia sp. T6]|uniref:Tripartite tricarboxylate transporter substrate binding protein n=1 Tax=Belnapia mucosa TaxID=2804532 RepID=A0ABS1V0D5_9PROT|nr:tripartite tricarboxylate transporter substrate-binding protein [Belnapia mucosa]MBL6455135.1 tripartite tricarboxylate transporter substrate binding protein [Belnapia mucosa]
MHRRTLLAASLLSAPALAQERFPSRPVRLVIPVAVAGVTDIVGRVLADAMAPILGKPVVVENIAGAGSTVGATAFQRSPADGHTIFLGTNNHAVMKTIYPQFPYDPMSDFTPLALVARQPFVLVVNPSVPVRTVPELLAWLRQRREAANYGAANPGGSNHLAGELLRQRAGVEFTIVPYRAAAASVQDVVAGRLDFTIDSPTMILPLLRDGQLRGLAVSTEAASPLVPDLPSLAEAGVTGYDMTIWQILFARPGTPPEALEALRGAAARALAEPAVRERLALAGCETWPDARPEAAQALLAREIARWTPIVAAMNLNPG